MADVAYVTQEMWDRAQAALRAALPVIEQHTPPLSTAGTMLSLREQVRAAIVGAVVTGAETRPPCLECGQAYSAHAKGTLRCNNAWMTVYRGAGPTNGGT